MKSNLCIAGLTAGMTQDGRPQIDGAVCLLKNSYAIAIAEERISGRKHAGGCDMGLRTILKNSKIGLNDIDYFYVSTCGEPVPETGYPVYIRDDGMWSLQDMGISENKICWCPSHHLSHALHAFHTSSFEQSIVCVFDFIGNIGEYNSYYFADKNGVNLYKRDSIPEHSTGGFGATYSLISDFLGFPGIKESGKTMALAGYGNPNALTGLSLFNKYNESWVSSLPKHKSNGKTVVKQYLCDSGFSLLADSIDSGNFQASSDLALLVQSELEDKVESVLNDIVEGTSCKNICIGGGVGLNCRLTGRLKKKHPSWNIQIPYSPGDTGQAIGNVLFGLKQNVIPLPESLKSPFLGPSYSRTYIEDTIEHIGSELKLIKKDPINKTASLLADGKIIALYHGRSEFGPRALGHRSILAHPGNLEASKRLNEQIKHREHFRPYGATVLESIAHELFYFNKSSSFMMVTAQIKDSWKERLKAVCHIDESCRIQTISEKISNNCMLAILKRFFELTGIPCLLNTSFNDSGKPIVETPEDAIISFLQMPLDALIIENKIMRRSM